MLIKLILNDNDFVKLILNDIDFIKLILKWHDLYLDFYYKIKLIAKYNIKL